MQLALTSWTYPLEDGTLLLQQSDPNSAIAEFDGGFSAHLERPSAVWKVESSNFITTVVVVSMNMTRVLSTP